MMTAAPTADARKMAVTITAARPRPICVPSGAERQRSAAGPAARTSCREKPRCRPRLLVCSIPPPTTCREYPPPGSREEVFPSAEGRPLAADGPLRAGPKSWLHLEARPSDPTLPLGPTVGGGPSRLRPLLPPRFSAEGPLLPHDAPAPPSPRCFGVGIDTSRYGHSAVFLRDDLQPAAAEL